MLVVAENPSDLTQYLRGSFVLTSWPRPREGSITTDCYDTSSWVVGYHWLTHGNISLNGISLSLDRSTGLFVFGGGQFKLPYKKRKTWLLTPHPPYVHGSSSEPVDEAKSREVKGRENSESGSAGKIINLWELKDCHSGFHGFKMSSSNHCHRFLFQCS